MEADTVESLPLEKLALLLDIEPSGFISGTLEDRTGEVSGTAQPPPAGGWNAADAAEALRHQLSAPLLPDIAEIPSAEVKRLQALAGGLTFLQALTASDQDPALLAAIKEFGRHWRSHPSSPLAGGPATVLYFAAIAAAQVHGHGRITTLSDDQILAGFLWAKVQPGGETVQELFESALARARK